MEVPPDAAKYQLKVEPAVPVAVKVAVLPEHIVAPFAAKLHGPGVVGPTFTAKIHSFPA